MSRLRVITALFALLAFVGCVKSDIPENRVFSIDDLANKKVGVLVGTTGEIYAADYGTDSTRLHAEKFETLAQAVDALLEGKIDAVLTDDAPAKVFARKNPSLRILNETFKEESYAGIVAKENMGLLDSVNIALIQMRAMGVYDSIFDSYIGGQTTLSAQFSGWRPMPNSRRLNSVAKNAESWVSILKLPAMWLTT